MLKPMKVTLECVYCVQFAEHVDQASRMMINYNVINEWMEERTKKKSR